MIFFIIISHLTCFIAISAATPVYQAGYTFDNESNLKWDLGGKYPLIERDFSPFEPQTGKVGNAVNSYFSLDPAMFSGISELTLGFWINFSEFDESYDTRFFYVGNGNETYSYLALDYLSETRSMSLRIFDGLHNELVLSDISPELSIGGWHHIVFTHDLSDRSGIITIYVDGYTRSYKNTDVTLDSLSTNVIFFSDFVIDEVYISNLPLSSNNVLKLNSMSLVDFFNYMSSDIPDVLPEDQDPEPGPDNPDEPVDPSPEGPENPDEPIEDPMDEGWKPPENLERIKFSWIGYTFDSTYDMSRDLNKTSSAIINEFSVTKVATAAYNGSFGYGITRRSSAIPRQYLKLNPGLLYKADSFTFCAWVYRSADKEDPFYNYSDLKLLDFSGYGKFEFSPFKSSEIPDEIYNLLVSQDELQSPSDETMTEAVPGTTNEPISDIDLTTLNLEFQSTPVLEFAVDSEFPTINNLSKTSLNNVSGRWIHYALSYSPSGEVKVYVNGALTDTFYTGQPFSALQLTDFRIMTGSSLLDSSKYFIDEVYIASRVVDASDIRKIKTYGIQRFTTEVLPDPSPEGSSSSPVSGSTYEEGINLRPDDTDNLEDSYTERAEIVDYVGTTFDDTSLIGKDLNNSVTAVIRNASLSQGIKNYGLTLDGINSYVRYPIGILDNAAELTFSIAYNWAGSTSSVNQKLMYFARKDSSISKPTAYMLIDMGNGTDGLSFEINDGTVRTTLKSKTTRTNEWVRVTVTIKDGSARLYINGALVDSASTSLNPASIVSNYNYIGKSGVKGEPLFKGVVDDIYISYKAISAQEIQAFEAHGIEPFVPEENIVENEENNDDIWDKIINGVVIATGILVFIIIIVIIVTIFKK